MSVQERIDRAKTDAAAALNKVASLSSARLKVILAMPPKSASRHRQDPQLVAADRRLLNQRLTNALPHRRSVTSAWQFHVPKAWQWIARRPRRSVTTATVLLLLGVAWWHTPDKMGHGRLTHDLVIEWSGPAGDRLAQSLPLGSVVAVVGQDGQHWFIRTWADAKGYYTAQLEPDDLTFDR